MGTSNAGGFSGPDRRAALPVPRAATESRACTWLLVVALVVFSCAPMTFALTRRSPVGDGWPISDLSGILGLTAIVVWFATWATSGRGSPARVALALVPCWFVLELSGTPARNISDRSTWSLATALASIAAVFLLHRARCSPDVEAAFRPFRALVLIGGGVALAGVGLLAATHLAGDVPALVTVSAGALAIGAWCSGAQMCRLSRRLEARNRSFMAFGFLCFAIGFCELTVGRLEPTSNLGLWSFTCGRAALLAGWCLVLVVALRSLDAARQLAGRRDYRLRFARDDVLGRLTERQHQIDERRHDLRSLISGIHDATATLTRYREFLDRSEQLELETALLAEVSRLRRSIDAPERSDTFDLRHVIGPVITAERLSGVVMTVDLVDAELVGNGDEVAALVQNLLTNARYHAFGAHVSVVAEVDEGALYLTIGDDGPGLPAAEQERVEVLLRGATVPESRAAGQASLGGQRSGLGLGICARIAREQRIELRLLDRSPGCHFELRLTVAAAREPAHSGSRV